MTGRPARPVVRLVLGAALAATAAAAGYLGLVTAAVPIDLGIGRRLRPLGPRTVMIGAPPEVVFDVIAQPYLGRATSAMREKVRVLQAGSDMVLAAHRTPIRGRLVATTLETVRFTRPDQVDFRLVRGPVPHVVEEFLLTERDGGTELTSPRRTRYRPRTSRPMVGHPRRSTLGTRRHRNLRRGQDGGGAPRPDVTRLRNRHISRHRPCPTPRWSMRRYRSGACLQSVWS
jgi:hypothetical protein